MFAEYVQAQVLGGMDAVQAAAVAYNIATLDNGDSDGASKGEDAGMGGDEAGAGGGVVGGGVAPVVPTGHAAR